DPPGALRPNIILDRSRSGRETPRLPGLFQPASRSLGLKRTAARSRGYWCAIKLGFVPMAEALSRTVSDVYRRVISGIRQLQLFSPKQRTKPGPKGHRFDARYRRNEKTQCNLGMPPDCRSDQPREPGRAKISPVLPTNSGSLSDETKWFA